MIEYRPPLKDISFALNQLAGLDEICSFPAFDESDPDFVSDVLTEAGKLAADVIAPLNAISDKNGARLTEEGVITTPGFPAAYQKYSESGMGSAHLDPEWGGGGMPYVVGTAIAEMVASASFSFSLGVAMSEGLSEAVGAHASEALKKRYLEQLITGEYSAAMALTEPQAGSDLGLLRTKAERADDGSYRISGTKIFITFGDHDMTDNIVHLVLARLNDAPEGTRGISCFLVPKFLPDGSRNDMEAVALEHKLGIHGSPTCVMNYGEAGGAIGWLVGEENQGLRCMFTMMNKERIYVGVQGLAIAERAYQEAVAYAHDRRQGRAVGVPSDGQRSQLVNHADIRLTLLLMKARIEAMRALTYTTAGQEDIAHHHPDEAVRTTAAERVALLTPVIKAWNSELGCTITSDAIQVFGGMGYVEESGVAQLFRDARIGPIYEGTNGIQSWDLVRRKLPLREGAVLAEYLSDLRSLLPALEAEGTVGQSISEHLGGAIDALEDASRWALGHIADKPRDAAAAASDYLRLMGLVCGGWHLANAALQAKKAGMDAQRVEVRMGLAQIYAERDLVRAGGLCKSLKAGSDALYRLNPTPRGVSLS